MFSNSELSYIVKIMTKIYYHLFCTYVFIFQPASSAEIWKWIHSEYGDELGLTSEDESDYHPPFRSSFKPGLVKNSITLR